MSGVELESAVNDAARMARVTVEYIGQVSDFDALEPRRGLSRQERQLLLFVVTQTAALAEQARDAFYDKEA